MNRETLQQMLEIQNIPREYLKNLYSIKLENLKEMDEFLDPSKPPKSQEEINNLNRPVVNKEIETATTAFRLKQN